MENKELKELLEMEIYLNGLLIDKKKWIVEEVQRIKKEADYSYYNDPNYKGERWCYSTELTRRLTIEHIEPLRLAIKVVNSVIDEIDPDTLAIRRYGDGGGI